MMTKRSNHIPMFTRIDTTNITGMLRRIFRDQYTCGTATLQNSIDSLFRHEHLYDEAGWRKILSDAGFEVEAVEPVLSSATTVAFEALLVPSLAGKLNKTLTTRWTNFPGARRALSLPVYALAKSLLDRNDPTPTAEFLAIGRRPES